MSPDQRRELAARITAAQAARSARAARAEATPAAPAPAGAPAAAPSPEAAPMQTPDDVLHELLAVLPELQAQVTECQTQHAPQVTAFRARLTLTGDPDIGTVIDASELQGAEPSAPPLPPAFDDCVRDRMQTLELPPISSSTEFSTSMVFDLTAPDDER